MTNEMLLYPFEEPIAPRPWRPEIIAPIELQEGDDVTIDLRSGEVMEVERDGVVIWTKESSWKQNENA